jgi:hypothetical protein
LDFRRVKAFRAGGDGVEIGTEDGAVVSDDDDGTRRDGLPGVEKPETIEPKLSSGLESRELSAYGLNAPDISGVFESGR